LGVLPLSELGLQESMHYVTGLGSRIGSTPGRSSPGTAARSAASWRISIAVQNQLRPPDPLGGFLSSAGEFEFSTRIRSPGRSMGNRTEYGIKLQATAGTFAGSDWSGPYLKKDNVELVGSCS
jgi:hypothetical protein